MQDMSGDYNHFGSWRLVVDACTTDPYAQTPPDCPMSREQNPHQILSGSLGHPLGVHFRVGQRWVTLFVLRYALTPIVVTSFVSGFAETQINAKTQHHATFWC